MPNLSAAIKKNCSNFDEDAFLRNVGQLSPIDSNENNCLPQYCQIDLAISSPSTSSDSSQTTCTSQNKYVGEKMDKNIIDFDENESCLEPFVLLTEEAEKSYTNYKQKDDEVESMEISHETQEAANILMNELCNDIKSMEKVEETIKTNDMVKMVMGDDEEGQNVASEDEEEDNVTVIEVSIDHNEVPQVKEVDKINETQNIEVFPEQNNKTDNTDEILPEKNTEKVLPEQNNETDNIDEILPEQNNEGVFPEKNNEKVVPEKNAMNSCDAQKILADKYKCFPSTSSTVSEVSVQDFNSMRNEMKAISADLQLIKEFIQNGCLSMMPINTDTTK